MSQQSNSQLTIQTWLLAVSRPLPALAISPAVIARPRETPCTKATAEIQVILTSHVDTSKFSASVAASIANGERLTEDAELLLENERSASAYAVAVLAQEEFAKALLLHLVHEGALPWSIEVRQALRDHVCKHLATAVLDFVCPDTDEFLRRYGNANPEGDPWRLPAGVVDAIHVMVHERIPRKSRERWLEPGSSVDPDIGAVSRGAHDRQKQNAIYVDIAKDGSTCSDPKNITADDARHQVVRAQRIGQSLRPPTLMGAAIEMRRTLLIFKVLTKLISTEEFRSEWL